MSIWILAADENRGRVFEAQSSTTSDIIEREALVHPEAKLPERSLASDAPGYKQAGRGAPHRVNEAGEIRHQHAQQFAREIAARLKVAQQEKQFRNLVLVAAPRFLGVLRKEIDGNLSKQVCLEIDKDFTQLSASEIRKRLPKRLPVPRI